MPRRPLPAPAPQVKGSAINSSTFYVFVSPPSMEELEARLRGRGTEEEEKIVMRLAGAQAEMDKSQVRGAPLRQT